MNGEEKSVELIEYKLVDAFLKGDTNALGHILAEEFILTDPHGPSFTKAQYLADLKTGRISFKSLVIDEIEVRVIDNTAVVTGKATAEWRFRRGAVQRPI